MEAISWFIIFLALILFEILTLGLTTIWFAVGALAAFLAAVFNAPLIVQVILFIVISIVMLVFTRPLAQRYINNRTVKTNVDTMKGKIGKVEETIDNINATGRILVDGNEWTARSKDETVIEVGAIVKVVEIEGVKAIVEKQ